MDIVTIVVALVLAFIAWKVLTGILKIGAILAVVVLAAWFLTNGGLS